MNDFHTNIWIFRYKTCFFLMLHTVEKRRMLEALTVKDNSEYLSHWKPKEWFITQQIRKSFQVIKKQPRPKQKGFALQGVFLFSDFHPLLHYWVFFRSSFYLFCIVNSLPEKDSITEKDNNTVIRNWSLSKVHVLFETLMQTQRIKWIILCCKSEFPAQSVKETTV